MWGCSIVIFLSWWVSPAYYVCGNTNCRCGFCCCCCRATGNLRTGDRDGWGKEEEKKFALFNQGQLLKWNSGKVLHNNVSSLSLCITTGIMRMRQKNDEGTSQMSGWKHTLVMTTLHKIDNHHAVMWTLRKEVGGRRLRSTNLFLEGFFLFIFFTHCLAHINVMCVQWCAPWGLGRP